MSFVPSGRADSDDESKRKKKSARGVGGRKVERFGAGMERGGREEEDVKESERNGRTRRRTGVRSGSKNAFRRGV
jgi:ribosome biogenesis protein ENP2